MSFLWFESSHLIDDRFIKKAFGLSENMFGQQPVDGDPTYLKRLPCHGAVLCPTNTLQKSSHGLIFRLKNDPSLITLRKQDRIIHPVWSSIGERDLHHLQDHEMLELDILTHNVLRNCDITDSKHAGLYSICGLALRLRDLYKWEQRLDPWVEKDSSEILEWIGNKESTWETLVEEDYLKLPILGKYYDPFDTIGINTVLEPWGLLYGAGYARSLKPTFFLAPIENKKKINGFTVYTLGLELARDLLTIPALSQDNCILLRKGSGRLFLWDQIFYIKKSGRPVLNFALAACGVKDRDVKALQRSLSTIYRIQKETYIFHEIGEICDTVFNADIWRQIIAAFPQTAVELLARTVKDLLADTNEYGPLQHIIRERHTALLAFYVAFLDGLAKALFPEMGAAFLEFTVARKWQVIERAVSIGYITAKGYAQEMMRIFQEGQQRKDMIWTQNEIEEQLLKKVTCRARSV